MSAACEAGQSRRHPLINLLLIDELLAQYLKGLWLFLMPKNSHFLPF